MLRACTASSQVLGDDCFARVYYSIREESEARALGDAASGRKRSGVARGAQVDCIGSPVQNDCVRVARGNVFPHFCEWNVAEWTIFSAIMTPPHRSSACAPLCSAPRCSVLTRIIVRTSIASSSPSIDHPGERPNETPEESTGLARVQPFRFVRARLACTVSPCGCSARASTSALLRDLSYRETTRRAQEHAPACLDVRTLRAVTAGRLYWHARVRASEQRVHSARAEQKQQQRAQEHSIARQRSPDVVIDTMTQKLHSCNSLRLHLCSVPADDADCSKPRAKDARARREEYGGSRAADVNSRRRR